MLRCGAGVAITLTTWYIDFVNWCSGRIRKTLAAWVKELTEHAIMIAINLTVRVMSLELTCERIVEKFKK